MKVQSNIQRFKVNVQRFKVNDQRFTKLLTLHEDRTYWHQFTSIILSELESTTVEVRTQ
jgi:hypothetical protein